MSAGAPSASDAIGLSRANLVRAIRLPRSGTASGVIPELNVILDVVVASGERRRLGRRRLTRFPHVAPKVDLPALCRRRRPRPPSVT